jgi:hypothetical protein
MFQRKIKLCADKVAQIIQCTVRRTVNTLRPVACFVMILNAALPEGKNTEFLANATEI